MRGDWRIVLFSLVVFTAFMGLSACNKGGTEEAAESAETGPAVASGSLASAVIDKWTDNAEGISGYTVTLTTDGSERTENYVKEDVNGIPVFVPEGTDPGSQDAMGQLPQLLATAREQGSGNVGGTATQILVVDDANALATLFPSEGGPFRPTRMEIQVGRDDLLVRQITLQGQATIPGGETRDVTNVVFLEDWRTVEGFAYPFRTTTRVEGLSDMVQSSAAELDAAAAEMERQIAQLPEAQREAARQAMAGRLQAARQMASGEPLESVTEVKDLQVRR